MLAPVTSWWEIHLVTPSPLSVLPVESDTGSDSDAGFVIKVLSLLIIAWTLSVSDTIY